MPLSEKFGVVILVLSSAVQIANRRFLNKYAKLVFFLSSAALLSSAAYSAFLQYEEWQAGAFSIFFLPPYQSGYFFYYVGWRIFAPLIVSFITALFFKFVSEFFNRRLGERFLEPEESWLLALGILLSGYPGFLLYIPLMLAAAVLLSLFYALLKKGRAPLFYLWLPAAVFAILLKSLIPQAALNFLII